MADRWSNSEAPADADVPASSSRSPNAILAVVGFAVFVAADDLTVVTTMLRPIINSLGLTLPDGLDDAAWIVNVYLIAFVAIMPLAGRLSDVIGRRRLLVIAYAVFTIGTTVIPLSDSLVPFYVGRVLTAVGGGAMVPVALAVVGDVFPVDRRARALGTLGAIETLGWVWGPLYGALLVRFLDWRWQFWLNIPLAVIGTTLIWWALDGLGDGPGGRRRAGSVDWIGAVLLALTLIALNLALLGNSEIQSVSGLDELQGGSGFDFRLLYPVAIALGTAFIWQQRRTDDPLIDPRFFRGRNLRVALGVNFLVGAALIIAMVDVPIFVNAIEIDLERSAVVSGWILAALTASMSLASWLGGRLVERTWYRPPIVAGLIAAAIALAIMGLTWDPAISYWFAAFQLALLGTGLGLVFAPTTAAVVDASPPDQRGAAAAIVMIVRLVGLSVGLAALTAWGLARFNSSRAELELPPITDPGFQAAITEASARLTADAIAETFGAAAVLMALGVVGALFMRNRPPAKTRPPSSSSTSSSASASANTHTHTSTSKTGETMSESTHQQHPLSAAEGQPSSTGPWLLNNLAMVLGILTVGLLGALVAIALLVNSLNSTQDELAQTQADLVRVEEGAAGSAIVAAQVLDISRQLTELEPQITEGLDQAILELDNFGTSTIDFDIAVDEVVTIDTDIQIARDFSFPIDESITIDQVVDTTIEIDTGLGFRVPVDVSVPVKVDVPIQLDVDVPIDETVPVNVDVPIALDVPISVNLADTELNRLASQLADGLRSVRQVVRELNIG